ncbi:MAG: nuclear transport factor 2 family protein [Acidimicrobiales bacterium]
MKPADAVRALYEAYQDRDWERARACLHEDAIVDMPATLDRAAGRDPIIDFERSYPEPWDTLTVHRVFGDEGEAAAEIGVKAPDGARFGCGAFWRTKDGLLHYGVEYWMKSGGELPPAVRADLPTTVAARAAWESSLRG